MHTKEVITVLEGHKKDVRTLALTHNGTALVTGSLDGTARYWDLQKNEGAIVLEKHTKDVRGVAVSSELNIIVSSSDDTTVTVWNLKSGVQIGVLSGHKDRVRPVALSTSVGDASPRENPRVVTGSFDATAIVWDINSCLPIATLTGHTSWVMALAYSPNGQLIVTASHDHTARIWDASTFQEIGILEGHRMAIYAVAFTPDSSVIITASFDQLAICWDAQTLTKTRELTGHTSWLYSIAVSWSGELVLTGSHDTTARLWQLKDGTCKDIYKDHRNAVTAVAFCPDDRSCLTACDDGSVLIWNIAMGIISISMSFTEPVHSLSISSDGILILAVGNNLEVMDLGSWVYANAQSPMMLRKGLAFADEDASRSNIASHEHYRTLPSISQSVAFLTLQPFIHLCRKSSRVLDTALLEWLFQAHARVSYCSFPLLLRWAVESRSPSCLSMILTQMVKSMQNHNRLISDPLNYDELWHVPDKPYAYYHEVFTSLLQHYPREVRRYFNSAPLLLTLRQPQFVVPVRAQKPLLQGGELFTESTLWAAFEKEYHSSDLAVPVSAAVCVGMTGGNTFLQSVMASQDVAIFDNLTMQSIVRFKW